MGARLSAVALQLHERRRGARHRRAASRADRFPIDVIWLDIDYQDRNRPFTVDAKTFPDMPKLVARHGQGRAFKLVTITDLHVAYLPDQGYAPYDSGAAGDHFVKNADGSIYVAPVWPGPSVFPDFTRASTRAWWGSLYKDFIADGFAGFWNDMNEPAVFETPTKTMPLDNRHRIEGDDFAPRTASHAEIHNVYGMENSRATFEGMERLRAQHPAVRDDPRLLCRRPALRRHLDRRQQLDLGPSAAVGAAIDQPRPVGFCL